MNLKQYEYYQTDLGVLYHGDCLEIMPHLEPVDLVLADPPYGIDWVPRVNHTDQTWIDDKQFDPRPFLKVGEKHCFWGGNYFAHLLPPSQGWATWVKRPLHGFSNDKRTYATTELAWTDYGKNRFKCIVWDGGKRQGDVINRTFCHPSQKPIELIMWCIPADSDLVFDSFLGSGTTAIACERLNRKWIGIEIEEKYAEIAAQRIESEVKKIKKMIIKPWELNKLKKDKFEPKGFYLLGKG